MFYEKKGTRLGWFLASCLLLGISTGEVAAGESGGGGPPPITSLKMVTQVKTLGDPRPMELHDGYVHLGAWELSPLGAKGATSFYYLARVPLAFELEGGSRVVRSLTLQLRLASPGALVHDLFPDAIDETGQLSFFVAPDYRFASGSAGASVRQLGMKVEPLIRGFGRSNQIFKWTFTTLGNRGVASGDRFVYFVLAAPAALRTLEVRATADFDIGRELLGVWYENSSQTVSQKLSIDLPDASADERMDSRATAAATFVSAAPADQTKPADVAGHWKSDFGVLTFEQQGNAVSGTYSCCQGRLEGRIAGRYLDLEWQDELYGKGWVRFELAAGDRELRGKWGKAGSPQALGDWNARRPAEVAHRGEASFWRVEGKAGTEGTLDGTATLYTEGARVTGKIDANFTTGFQGTRQRIPVINELEGKWREGTLGLTFTNPLDGSRGTLQLRQSPRGLEGTWETFDRSSRGEIVFLAAEKTGKVIPGAPSATEIAEKLAANARGRKLASEADSLRLEKKWAAAAERYRQSIALIDGAREVDRLAMAHYGLGLCQRKLGLHTEADTSFQAVLDLREADESVRSLARMAMQ